MGRKKNCTPELRRIIATKYCIEKKSIRAIAKDLLCSKTMVNNAIKQYTENGTIENKKRKPRPRKTTKREDRIICKVSKDNPFLTSKQINIEVAAHLDEEVSARTIRRRLLEKAWRRKCNGLGCVFLVWCWPDLSCKWTYGSTLV